jgi:DNA-binding MarR family transcriptional regulator
MEPVGELAVAIESVAESLLAALDCYRHGEGPPVPPAQMRVLAIVAGNRAMNMSRLAEALEVVPSSASRLCDRLEATGFLRRDPDPRDRREVRLLLTARAREMLIELRDRRRASLMAVLDRMSETTRHELVRAMTAFDVAYHARTDEDTRRRTA